MAHDPDVSAIAALIADRSRLAILSALADGKAYPAGELARFARVSAQTGSSHLTRLLEGGLIAVEAQGRHRYYRLANEQIGVVLESMAVLAPAAPALASWQTDAAKTLRFARTCYGHLAGMLGVAVADALKARGCLCDSDAGWSVTADGEAWFGKVGIDVQSLRARPRPLVRMCLDWSERRYHLAGALGSALAERSFAMGWLAPVRQSRAVRLTDRGRTALKEGLGIAL